MAERGRSPLHPFELARRLVAPHRPLLALILLALVLYLPSVWLRDPWQPDEPRYAEVAREMVSSGEWVLPHLNGEVYGEKPPLYFWLGILAGHLPGVPFEAGPRLVSALAALLTLLLTFHLGRRLADGPTAWLACLVLATSSMFVQHATTGVIDGTLTLIVTASIVCGLRAAEDRSGLLWGSFYLLAGLAVITKGPVGLAIPAGVLLLVSVQQEGWKGARAAHPLWGAGIVAAVTAAWLVPAIARGGAEYADIILLKQNVGRAWQSWHHREPVQYFLYVFPISFLPWVLLLPAALLEAWRRVREGGRRARVARVALTWFVFTFLFFSVISGKKTRYLLPLFPAAGLLIALEMRAFVSETTRRLRALVPLRIAAAAMSAGGLLLAAAPLGWAGRAVGGIKGLATDQVRALEAMTVLPGAIVLIVPGLLIAALGAAGLGLIGRDRKTGLAFTLAAAMTAVAWSQWVAVPALNILKSARPLAVAVQAEAGEGAPLVLYRESYGGILNLQLQRDRIPVISGKRRVQSFLEDHPGAIVIASSTDVDRLREAIPDLRIFHCRRVGDEPICAAVEDR